ncbi:MAG: alpha/beta hydrolase [Microthrixaceae bacterium]|nr:alpha/beta hydrolase [Microthrixaceae bacterium]MCO5307488.1 alpha/beta hydrolase [Microthrixaceae bacterium]
MGRRSTGTPRGAELTIVLLLAAVPVLLVVACTGLAPANNDPTVTTLVPGELAVRYGPAGRQVADVYPAVTGVGPRPVVIWVHGGGWAVGTRATIPRGIVELASQGISVVSIDHGMAPGAVHPTQVLDVVQAVNWVASTAAERNFDADNIFLIGHSSGGHLAMLAGFAGGDPVLDPGRPVIRGVVALAGMSHLEGMLGLDVTRDLAVRQYMGCPVLPVDPCDVSAANPDAYVDAGDPPLLLVHGTLDLMVPVEQSRSMAAIAQAAGMSVNYFETTDDHDTIFYNVNTDLIRTWIEVHLLPTEPPTTDPPTTDPPTTDPPAP